MSDPFLDFCSGVQAVRRLVERQIAGLGGALGVAAIPYPHQIGNVQRVLTDSRIRHLIADEVGLGKTVQALMVVNALRLQNPSHRTLILVPENLAPQWVLECQTRAHFVPLNYGPSETSTAYHVRLAYYEQLQSVTEIDPATYDLLIVDEIQRLQGAMRQRIADVAGDFRQLLLLSATPRLDDVDAFRQLLTILEPERMAVARRGSPTPETSLRQREASIAEALRSNQPVDWSALDILEPPEGRRGANLAAAFSVLRRVTNTRRREYPDLLPQRVLHRIAIEPTGDEVARQEQVWRFIGHAAGAEEPTDLARLGQVALRSPRALSERINVLRGRDQRDPHGFLQAATKHLDAANGDSRLEALIDILVDVFANDPNASVIVVADDNPTVDYLERMVPQYLPEVGPRASRKPLSLAVKRNRDASATSDLVELFGEYDESLGRFIDGDDQILIAADIAQVGLNLQHARTLIFFSMPWSPAAVEQWIGRLDRLGSAALADDALDPSIDIYAIYQHGQVDERVVTVLDDFGIFKRSIRLDGQDIITVTQHIIDAALKPHVVNWASLSREARSFAAIDGAALSSPLAEYLPWGPRHAVATSNYIDRSGSVRPVLQTSKARRAIVRAEAALRGWIRLLGEAKELRLWSGADTGKPARKLRLLHHYRPSTGGPVVPRFALPGVDPMQGQRYAYLDGRRSLNAPPATTATVDDNPYTPVHFMDHGNPLHETLVAEWARIGRSVRQRLTVTFPDGHLLANPEARGLYMLAVLQWVPGAQHLSPVDHKPVYRAIENARTQQERIPLFEAIQRLDEDFRADQRWLNSLFVSRLDVLAARLRETEWELVEPDIADALVTPWRQSFSGRDATLARSTHSGGHLETEEQQTAGMALIREQMQLRHIRSLSECPDLFARIASRRFLLATEGDDLVKLRQAAFDDATAQGLESSEQGFARSRFRMLRNARDMALLSKQVRLRRLDGLTQALRHKAYDEYKLLFLTVE